MITEKDTETALYEIAKKDADFYAAKLQSLPGDLKNERKALSISKNEAGICAGFVKMRFDSQSFSARYYEVREKRIFGGRGNIFSLYKEIYDKADEMEKHCFLIYAHAVIMVHTALYDRRTNELKKAKEDGNAETAFTCGIITGTLEKILSEWRAWWKTNGSLKTEV